MHEFNPFSINKPKFLDILGFSDFNLDKERKILELKFNASAELTHSNDTIVQQNYDHESVIIQPMVTTQNEERFACQKHVDDHLDTMM